MSDRLATCPACGKLGLHHELPEEQSAELYKYVGPCSDQAIRWRFRTSLCMSCGRPIISLWPFENDVGGVLRALGLSPQTFPHSNGGNDQ